MVEITQAMASEAGQISALARPIWEEHYTPIIGEEQVDYMLEKFQSEEAIKSQIEEGYQYFLVKVDALLAGYMSSQLRDNTLFLSKFYLSSSFRGQGIAKSMLNHIIDNAKTESANIIELTVNKFNPAYKIYLKLGFENIESIQMDIGQGYIMDDYLMQLTLS